MPTLENDVTLVHHFTHSIAPLVNNPTPQAADRRVRKLDQQWLRRKCHVQRRGYHRIPVRSERNPSLSLSLTLPAGAYLGLSTCVCVTTCGQPGGVGSTKKCRRRSSPSAPAKNERGFGFGSVSAVSSCEELDYRERQHRPFIL